jgi:hypothetical protein
VLGAAVLGGLAAAAASESGLRGIDAVVVGLFLAALYHPVWTDYQRGRLCARCGGVSPAVHVLCPRAGAAFGLRPLDSMSGEEAFVSDALAIYSGWQLPPKGE